MKVKSHLIIGLLSLSLIVTSLMAFLFYYNIKKIFLREVYTHLEAISETKKIRVLDMVAKKHELAMVIAGNYSMVEDLHDYMIHPSSQSYVKVEDILKKLNLFVQSIRKIKLVDMSGKVIVSTDSAFVGEDLSQVESFKAGKNKRPYFDGFHYNEFNELVVSLATPVYFQETMIAVLIIETTAEDVLSLTDDYTGLGKTGETTIGRIQKDTAYFLTPLRFDKNAATRRFLTLKDTTYLMNLAVSKKEGLYLNKKDYRDQDVIAAVRYIPQTNWGMVTKMDKSEVYQPIKQIRKILILVALFIMALALLIAYFLGNYIARPIEELTRSVRKLIRGDLTAKVTIGKRYKEIKILTESYNEMTTRLAKSIGDLQSSNQALERFAYVISHDLKSPLQSIQSLSYLISEELKTRGDKSVLQLLDLQMLKAKEMNDLILGVLEAATKRGTGVHKQQIDLNQIVKKVIENINPPENIKIIVPESLPYIYHQKIPMMQVFQNLIGNAVKYMDKEEGKIVIEYTSETLYYKFSITDNGPGIPLEDQSRIFQLFESGSRRNSIESSGIGLSIVKKIIEDNNGNIWIKSEEGKGTTFYFTIPK